MHQATFRLAGAAGYAALTGTLDASIALWCTDGCDLLRVRCSPADADEVVARIDDVAGVDDAVVDGGTVLAITDRCATDCAGPTVDAHLEAHGCLLLAPLRYEGGARRCRVLALDAERLTACYRSLRESFDVTVVSTRRLEADRIAADERAVPLAATLPSLTRRQRQVISLAVEQGYYEQPRETSMEAVASEVGIDRRTAEDHRRRAERKLLESLVERYLT